MPEVHSQSISLSWALFPCLAPSLNQLVSASPNVSSPSASEVFVLTESVSKSLVEMVGRFKEGKFGAIWAPLSNIKLSTVGLALVWITKELQVQVTQSMVKMELQSELQTLTFSPQVLTDWTRTLFCPYVCSQVFELDHSGMSALAHLCADTWRRTGALWWK